MLVYAVGRAGIFDLGNFGGGESYSAQRRTSSAVSEFIVCFGRRPFIVF